MTGSENEERVLIQKIREGDKYAFEIAFLKYYTPLCKYIWKYVRSEVLAEEIVQEVFTLIWEIRFNLDPSSGHLRGLLHEMARNKAIDYIKHQKIVARYKSEALKKKKRKAIVPVDHEETDDTLTIDIMKAIDELPPKARQIFMLNREEGLTYKEIAAYLDISPKTVESQMRRVFQLLRDILSKYAPVFLLISIGTGA